ncbi:MAG: hypothetical protein KatS3mg059_0391 [Thermomicrobiales bacterium]|nr:MAG: hypothetical protein KatS3mg059_0391 [Thermomicrobiales bacterium]
MGRCWPAAELMAPRAGSLAGITDVVSGSTMLPAATKLAAPVSPTPLKPGDLLNRLPRDNLCQWLLDCRGLIESAEIINRERLR